MDMLVCDMSNTDVVAIYNLKYVYTFELFTGHASWGYLMW